MFAEKCLYCGSRQLKEIDTGTEAGSDSRLVQCQTCRVMFSELEQRFENDRTPLDYKPKFDIRSEEAVLNEALKLIYRWEWNSALELLFQLKSPLERPAEFLLFRGICRAGAVLKQESILSSGSDYDHEGACGTAFDMLDNNLLALDYYLASKSEEERLSVLQRIYHLMWVFCVAPITVKGLPLSLQEPLANSLIQRSADLLGSFADYLEGLQGTPNGVVYLNMAAALWERAADVFKRRRVSNDYGERGRDEETISLAAKLAKEMEGNRERLAAEVSRRQPQSLPNVIPEDPASPSCGKVAAGCLLFVSLAAAVIVGVPYIFYTYGVINDVGSMLLMYGSEAAALTLLTMIFAPPQFLTDRRHKKQICKLYERLYTNIR